MGLKYKAQTRSNGGASSCGIISEPGGGGNKRHARMTCRQKEEKSPYINWQSKGCSCKALSQEAAHWMARRKLDQSLVWEQYCHIHRKSLRFDHLIDQQIHTWLSSLSSSLSCRSGKLRTQRRDSLFLIWMKTGEAGGFAFTFKPSPPLVSPVKHLSLNHLFSVAYYFPPHILANSVTGKWRWGGWEIKFIFPSSGSRQA